MNIMASVSGIHARSRKLIEATRKFERGELGYVELEKVLLRDIEDFIRVQEKAGLDIISDGMLNWHDPLRPIIECVEGVACGPYSRWFETNTFYRKPVIVGKPHVKEEYVRRFFKLNLVPEGRAKIAILPGPYTCAALSAGGASDKIGTFTGIVKELIRRLEGREDLYILLQEPCLVHKKYSPKRKQVPRLKKVYSQIFSSNPKKYIVHTFFGSAENALELLNGLECWVGLDMTETPYHILGSLKNSNIMLGLVDSQSPLIENSRTFKTLTGFRLLESKSLIVSPNTDLRYLPRKTADRKVSALRVLKEALTK